MRGGWKGGGLLDVRISRASSGGATRYTYGRMVWSEHIPALRSAEGLLRAPDAVGACERRESVKIIMSLAKVGASRGT